MYKKTLTYIYYGYNLFVCIFYSQVMMYHTLCYIPKWIGILKRKFNCLYSQHKVRFLYCCGRCCLFRGFYAAEQELCQLRLIRKQQKEYIDARVMRTYIRMYVYKMLCTPDTEISLAWVVVYVARRGQTSRKRDRFFSLFFFSYIDKTTRRKRKDIRNESIYIFSSQDISIANQNFSFSLSLSFTTEDQS